MSSQNDDISSNVLRQMKAGGFDFTRIHPIEFYAVFPDEAGARRPPGSFVASRSMLRCMNGMMVCGTWN
ncbi:hypothetical protein PspTeo4_01512 [Pseudomonas sp. Teo4]|nr:hypothetical protein [Pseudomonas sp. Teo4]